MYVQHMLIHTRPHKAVNSNMFDNATRTLYSREVWGDKVLTNPKARKIAELYVTFGIMSTLHFAKPEDKTEEGDEF